MSIIMISSHTYKYISAKCAFASVHCKGRSAHTFHSLPLAPNHLEHTVPPTWRTRHSAGRVLLTLWPCKCQQQAFFATFLWIKTNKHFLRRTILGSIDCISGQSKSLCNIDLLSKKLVSHNSDHEQQQTLQDDRTCPSLPFGGRGWSIGLGARLHRDVRWTLRRTGPCVCLFQPGLHVSVSRECRTPALECCPRAAASKPNTICHLNPVVAFFSKGSHSPTIRSAGDIGANTPNDGGCLLVYLTFLTSATWTQVNVLDQFTCLFCFHVGRWPS